LERWKGRSRRRVMRLVHDDSCGGYRGCILLLFLLFMVVLDEGGLGPELV